MSRRGPLLIVGASGRAAAASAIRAGFEPFVIDLFADEDTKRLCPVWKCPFDEYPHGFVPLAKHAPPSPWVYTGGLENDPDVVAAISETRELIGNGPEVLREVRDPAKLAAVCGDSGIAFPPIISFANSSTPATSIRWLRKSLRSSAGRGVRPFDASPFTAGEYLQEFVPGESMSASFDGDRLIGMTKQLVGESWLHASAFGYCGNVTRRAGAFVEPLRHIASTFAKRFGLTGMWGIDFIDRDGTPVVVEVNPRVTAAIEIVPFARRSGRVVGKAIYFASQMTTFPLSGPWDESLEHCTDVWRRPEYADIPAAGSTIDKGQPVLTIFAEGDTEDNVLRTMKVRAAELDRLFS